MSGPTGPLASLVGLASAWANALAGLGGSLSAGDDLPKLAGRLALLAGSGLSSPEQADHAGREIGRLLAEAFLTAPTAVERAVSVLGEQWLSRPDHTPDGVDPRCVIRMQGALAAGHAEATQRLLLAHQEAMHRAALGARDRAQRAQRAADARFKAVFTAAAVGIAIADTHGQLLDANEALQGMVGYSLDELRTLTLRQLVHPDDVEAGERDHAALVAGRVPSFHAERRYLHRDGHTLWAQLSVSLVRGDSRAHTFQVAVIEDVTARHRLRERLQYEAAHDSLTGLPNRAQFLERLEQTAAGQEPGHSVVLCFLDLDHFRLVNDSRGHVAGDQVLIEVAYRLATVADPARALLARSASDEFAVLLSGPPGRLRPIELAQALLDALGDPVLVDGQPSISVQASAGVVELPLAAATSKSLLRGADLALREAKEGGRGRAVAHDLHDLPGLQPELGVPC